MILAIFGRPGAGKSYSAVKLSILPALQAGRPVWTNVPVLVDAVREDYPDAQLTVVDDVNSDSWAGIANGSLVVLDELGKIWPAGAKSSQLDKRDLEFIAEHRHRVGEVNGTPMAMDIVLIAQGSSDIASFLRSKISRTMIVEKLSAVGADSRYRVDQFSNFQDSERPRHSALLASAYGSYEPKIYRYYRSHSRATPGLDLSGVTEKGATRKVTIFQSFRFRFFLVCLLLAFVLFIWFGRQASEGIKERTRSGGAAAASTHLAKSPGVPASAVSASSSSASPSVKSPVSESKPIPVSAPASAPAVEWYIGGYAEWRRPDDAESSYRIQLRHVQGLARMVEPEKGKCRKRIGILTCDLGDGLVVSDVPVRLGVVAGVPPRQAQP